MSTDSKSRQKVSGKFVAKELLPGCSQELLKALHLLTRSGDLNADALRKLKQVNHLVRLLTPALEDIFARSPQPTVVDCGAGKSYLGFILYELFFKDRPEATGQVLSLESRADLSQNAAALARTLKFERMQFQATELSAAVLPERVHLVTALHACDTATDDALALAIKHRADHVAVIPCCQAEVARQLEKTALEQRSNPIHLLHEHAWHRREFGSHLTNVIRALCLQAHGYQVTVTELAGWEHALKNELIIGRKVNAYNSEARDKLAALLAATGVNPRLMQLLSE